MHSLVGGTFQLLPVRSNDATTDLPDLMPSSLAASHNRHHGSPAVAVHRIPGHDVLVAVSLSFPPPPAADVPVVLPNQFVTAEKKGSDMAATSSKEPAHCSRALRRNPSMTMPPFGSPQTKSLSTGPKKAMTARRPAPRPPSTPTKVHDGTIRSFPILIFKLLLTHVCFSCVPL